VSRIGRVYETRFRAILKQLGARRPERGVELLMARALRESGRENAAPARALAKLHARLRRTCRRRKRELPAGVLTDPRFICDAGLGGLARWLRAAGYEADWEPAIDDSELLRAAARSGAIALTTDSLLLDRRVVHRGEVAVFWVAPTLTMLEQMAEVFDEFSLRIRETPRCMRCGGPLVPVQKEEERARIPPKTWRWLDEYFRCSRCHQLFWKGTHWRRIHAQLRAQAGLKPG
jgi:uncharacterized protein with PIN domain